MSHSSVMGRWIETPGLDTLFEADKPVTVLRAWTLINNINHLRDTSTQQRVCHVSYVGETITPTDFGGDAVNSCPIAHFTTPWTLLEPQKPARPVLRVAAHRNAAGTSYLSAGLFPFGARLAPNGYGAIAFWPEVAFTNTTAAVVIEDAEDSAWRPKIEPLFGIRMPDPLGLLPTQGGGPDGRTRFQSTDPLADGSSGASSPNVLMVTLVIFVRHTGSSETRVSLVDLREFAGP